MARVASAIVMLLMLALEVCGGALPVAQARPLTANASPSCATSPDPTGGPRCGGHIVYSARDKVILARKNALVQEFMAVRAGKLAYATFDRDWQVFMRQYGGPTTGRAAGPECAGGNCNYKYLDMPQQAQTTNYYCGPASASEALYVRLGYNVSQSTLAGNSYLQTNENGGTNWGYPYVMPATLNDFTGSSFYEAVDAYDGVNNNTTSTFESDLQTDINTDWAVVIGVYEEANTYTPHLAGHPDTIPISHWIAAYGYDTSGADVSYDDSVYDATSISWYKDVKSPSSTISSSNMNTMMAQR